MPFGSRRRDSVVFTWRILSYLGEMIAGRQSAKELGGPIKIAEISGQAAQLGWATLIHFMAILSLNLGLINLFPIPVLDGGHLAMYGVEAVRGRPLSLKIQELSFRGWVCSRDVFNRLCDLERRGESFI